MELTQDIAVEPVSKSEILALNTWDTPRTSEQLLGFIARREAKLPDSIDL